MNTWITHLFCAALISCAALPSLAQDIHNQGATIYISPNTTMHTNGNVVNHTGSTIQNYGDFTVNGDMTNQATFNGTGKITMMGTTTQTLDMGGSDIYSLLLNNPANVQCAASFVVTHQLDMQAGNLTLGSNNVTISSAATITNYSSTSYIVTNSTGNLTQNNIGTSGRTGTIDFPIGSSTSYNPVSINNTGTKDNFSTKVYPTIYNSYTAGAGNGGALSSNKEVDRTWIVNEATAGGSNITLTLQWNSADEDASFLRSNSAIALYSNGAWVMNNTGGSAASGAAPYTRSRAGLTEFSNTPYGIGSSGSPLPVKFSGFDVVKKNMDGHITWSTETQYNADNFEVERSFDAIHFESIGTVAAVKNTNANNYAYDDKMVLQNMVNTNTLNVYYRIKEVDVDGKTQSTGIKSLQVKGNSAASITTMEGVKLLPNPFTDNFAMLYNMNSNMRVDFRLLDMSGKLIYTQNANAMKGLNQFEFKGLENLAQGVYMIEANLQNGEKQLYKIVKN